MHPEFTEQLDFTARPGTKTYPRWKDALLGCFKKGRYPHLGKVDRKEALRQAEGPYLAAEAQREACKPAESENGGKRAKVDREKETGSADEGIGPQTPGQSLLPDNGNEP